MSAVREERILSAMKSTSWEGATLTRPRSLLLLVFAALACAFGSGCGDARDDFVQGRAPDTCDEAWPVCGEVAGCVLGNQSYREGRFPGETRFAVRLEEPSLVRVSFFLEEVGAAGEETVVTLFEDGCRARVREAISGRTFVGEAERNGVVFREATLTGKGDHLIELHSDAQARFLVKVDITPTRSL